MGQSLLLSHVTVVVVFLQGKVLVHSRVHLIEVVVDQDDVVSVRDGQHLAQGASCLLELCHYLTEEERLDKVNDFLDGCFVAQISQVSIYHLQLLRCALTFSKALRFEKGC